MTKSFALNELEAKRLAELIQNLNEKEAAFAQAQREARIGFTMLIAQHEVEGADFQSLEGTTLTVVVPD